MFNAARGLVSCMSQPSDVQLVRLRGHLQTILLQNDVNVMLWGEGGRLCMLSECAHARMLRIMVMHDAM